jgi:tRNA(Ile)-lysidine synthase
MADDGMTKPLSCAEICTIFAPFQQTHLVLGVSGGPDSVAMMGMAALWRDHIQPEITVHIATVDHGLRRESRSEADQVAHLAASLGFRHDILSWDGIKPKTGIQEAARQARYNLLTQKAIDLGAALLTAHTSDDQAETILFRLLRGSGIAGLSGMREKIERGGVAHYRPLLHMAKTRLIATCLAQGWPFIEDPSNLNPVYARARMRRLLPILADEGLTPAALNRLGMRLEKADLAIETRLDTLWPDIFIGTNDGSLALNLLPLRQEPVLLWERTLQRGLNAVEPGHLQRLEKIERAAAEFQTAALATASLRRSLGHCVLSLNRKGIILMRRAGSRQRGLQRN